jgi:RNA polymerase sigma-70 factor (ECF subfamily)
MAAPLEAEFVRRVQAGSPEERKAVFGEIYESLRERTFALCFHLTGNSADAEDAFQEAFLAVYRGLRGFQGLSKLSTWVYRIAIRAAFRVKSRRRTSPRLPPSPMTVASAADSVIRNEETKKLSRVLAALSADHRVILSLFALQGLSHHEVAEILGIPVGTVWSRVHLARKSLASALEKSRDGGP